MLAVTVIVVTCYVTYDKLYNTKEEELENTKECVNVTNVIIDSSIVN